MRGGARFLWNREFDVSDQLPRQPAQTRSKVFKIEISEPLIGGGGKYNVELTVDLDKYTDWTSWDAVNENHICILKSDKENKKVKNYLNQNHVKQHYRKYWDAYRHDWITEEQECGLEDKKAQQKETVYTLIDALAEFLVGEKIDSADHFEKKKQIITKDDVMEAQFVNNQTKQKAFLSMRSKFLDSFYSSGRTKNPCVVKISLVLDTTKKCVNFIVTEYTVVRYKSFSNSEFGREFEYRYRNWDTEASSELIVSKAVDPASFFDDLKKKLEEFKGTTFYQVASAKEGTRDYMGIFTFDEQEAKKAASPPAAAPPAASPPTASSPAPTEPAPAPTEPAPAPTEPAPAPATSAAPAPAPAAEPAAAEPAAAEPAAPAAPATSAAPAAPVTVGDNDD